MEALDPRTGGASANLGSLAAEEAQGELAAPSNHDNRLPKGGHFAAWEQPALFTEELRASLRSLRSA